jgi:hypothetical protein
VTGGAVTLSNRAVLSLNGEAGSGDWAPLTAVPFAFLGSIARRYSGSQTVERRWPTRFSTCEKRSFAGKARRMFAYLPAGPVDR